MIQVNQTNPNVLVHWMSYIFPDPIMDWLISFLMPISNFLGIPAHLSISFFYILTCTFASLIVYAALGSLLMVHILFVVMIVARLVTGFAPLSMWWIILIVLAIGLFFHYSFDGDDVSSSSSYDIKKQDSVIVSKVEKKDIVSEVKETIIDKEKTIEKRGALTIRK
jgi:hypothetical protein